MPSPLAPPPASSARYTPAIAASTPLRNTAWNTLPLVLSAAAASFVFWGPFTVPWLLAIFTTLFFIYWVVRCYTVVIGTAIGSRRMRGVAKTDWEGDYARWQTEHPGADAWNWPRHLVVIPNYRESEVILRRTLDSLATQTNADQIVIVLAMEARDPESAAKAARLVSHYKSRFAEVFSTSHPHGLPGEVAGKGSNEAWALRRAHERLIAGQGDDIARYTVTSCDADAVFHPRHFAALNSRFLTAPKRYRTFWQPIIFYFNNIWDIPAFLRIPNGLSGLNRLATLSLGGNTNLPMSCYSLSWSMLHEVDYWDEAIISEDWHCYLKCAYSLGDDVSIEPILLPLGNDCVYAGGALATARGQYLQYQRHAFGAQDIPYALRASLDPRSPLSPYKKGQLAWAVTKSHVIWVSQWFLLTLGWHLPLTLADHTSATMPDWWMRHIVTLPGPGLHPRAFFAGDFANAISPTVGLALPSLLFYLTIPSLFVVMVQEYRTRGPRPAHMPLYKALAGMGSWVFVGAISFFFSALPAIDAQIRLARGRSFVFRVAEKGNRELTPHAHAEPVALAAESTSNPPGDGPVTAFEVS